MTDKGLSLLDHVELSTRNEFLACLRVKQLSGEFPGRFGFVAWADQPPLTPYKVAVRVYAFDGRAIHIVWAPDEVITGNIETLVSQTDAGFQLLVRAPDRWTDTRQSYAIVSGNVQKIGELVLRPPS